MKLAEFVEKTVQLAHQIEWKESRSNRPHLQTSSESHRQRVIESEWCWRARSSLKVLMNAWVQVEASWALYSDTLSFWVHLCLVHLLCDHLTQPWSQASQIIFDLDVLSLLSFTRLLKALFGEIPQTASPRLAL